MFTPRISSLTATMPSPSQSPTHAARAAATPSTAPSAATSAAIRNVRIIGTLPVTLRPAGRSCRLAAISLSRLLSYQRFTLRMRLLNVSEM